MADKQSMQYGLAGGRSNQGQGFTRYQIAGDPSPYFPVFAAGGGWKASPPAYMMPARGGPYRYGNIHVNGLTNLISDGDVCRPIISDNFDINGFNTQTILGANTQSILTGQPGHTRVLMLQNALNNIQAIVDHNGEMVYQDTTNATGHYGAVSEGFNGVAGTATVVNGNATVNIAAGPTFTNVVLSTAYAYTPDFINPRVGDILEIVNAGLSQYYRITAINLTTGTLTSMGIYPAYAGPSNSGLTYKFWRTGYGSASNTVILYNNEDIYLYYVGNVTRYSLLNAGTLQCIHVNAKAPFTFQHYTAPSVGGIAGRPAAVDLVYFKGFLLYGAGNAVAWSVAGFPTDFTTGFGATDLPAISDNAFQTTGTFLYFEVVGDQVFANFTNGIYVVSTTGSVPEFAFIRLPTSAGGVVESLFDPQINNGSNVIYQRGSAQGESFMCYRSPSGLQVLQSTTPKRISVPVEAAQVPDRGQVQYSNTLGFFMWQKPDTEQAFAYFWETDEWTLLNFQEIPRPFLGLSPNVQISTVLDIDSRRVALAAWETNGRIYLISSYNASFESDCPGAGGTPGQNSITSWQWATPIISLGDIYEGFQLGSFRPLVRAAEGDLLTPPNARPTFQVTLYAGYSPTQMSAIYTATVDYGDGIAPAIQMPNLPKSDAPYVGFVFKGYRWVELVGVGLYPVGTVSRR